MSGEKDVVSVLSSWSLSTLLVWFGLNMGTCHVGSCSRQVLGTDWLVVFRKGPGYRPVFGAGLGYKVIL